MPSCELFSINFALVVTASACSNPRRRLLHHFAYIGSSTCSDPDHDDGSITFAILRAKL